MNKVVWGLLLGACVGVGAACWAVLAREMAAEAGAYRVVVAGAPASGKGTLCAALGAALGVAHVATGDLLRAEVAAGTAVGARVRDALAAGHLVDDALLVPLVRAALARSSASSNGTAGYVLDGFPRTAAQAAALWPPAGTADTDAVARPTHVVVLDVPDDVAVARVAGRRVDPATNTVYHLAHRPPPADDAALRARLVQRPDDTEATVRARLRTYHAHTAAWLAVLRAQRVPVLRVDATRAPAVVAADVLRALHSCRAPGTPCHGPAWWRVLADRLRCGSAMKPFC